MLCLLVLKDIVWVVGWFILYSWLILSIIYCAGFIILKLIDYIRKELDL
jgi:ABC-type microcin C transport system permease subunit YejE